MPGSKQIYFLPEDEAEFSRLLKEKFPGIIFVDGDFWNRETFPLIDAVDRAKGVEVDIMILPTGWKPKWGRVEDSIHLNLLNRPEISLRFRRSRLNWKDKRLGEEYRTNSIGEGVVHLVNDPPDNKAQRSFEGKVWRLIEKMATCRLKSLHDPDLQKGPWDLIPGKMFWAGHHAVQWALEDETRYFKSNTKTRPLDDVLII